MTPTKKTTHFLLISTVHITAITDMLTWHPIIGWTCQANRDYNYGNSN